MMEGHQTGNEDQEQDARKVEVGVPGQFSGEEFMVIYLLGVSRKSSSEQKKGTAI